MKLISLNTWSGRAGKEKLLNFFRRNQDIDIFCLQEVWEGGEDHAPLWGDGIDTESITNMQKVLKNHVVFFRPHYMDWYGLAIAAKKEFEILEEGDIFVFKERENSFDNDQAVNHARNLQYVNLNTKLGSRTIANFHGLWNGGGKEDNADRIYQSQNIANFLKGIKTPHILCGDFNLLPENQSLKNLENLGMRNLIKEFNVTSTRSSYYTKLTRFADYMLVSKDIKVNDFKILPDEVSDHLAMYLNFE